MPVPVADRILTTGTPGASTPLPSKNSADPMPSSLTQKGSEILNPTPHGLIRLESFLGAPELPIRLVTLNDPTAAAPVPRICAAIVTIANVRIESASNPLRLIGKPPRGKYLREGTTLS